VGMGVLPLVFNKGQGWADLGLTGTEVFSISGISDLKPRKVLEVRAEKENGEVITFDVTARLDTGVDVEYYVNGGILPYVLRKIAKSKRV
jgi:aconitate hydratase